MMPLFTRALQTLDAPPRSPAARRCSTSRQQIASSVGVAVMSVVLTNQLKGVKTPAGGAAAFSTSFWVAFVLVALTLVPAFFLPRRKSDPGATPETSTAATAVSMH